MDAKIREVGVKDGDPNTSHFHKLSNARARHNSLAMLVIDGVLLDDQEQLSENVVRYYDTLYKETHHWRPRLDGLEIASTSREDNNMLGFKRMRFSKLLRRQGPCII